MPCAPLFATDAVQVATHYCLGVHFHPEARTLRKRYPARMFEIRDHFYQTVYAAIPLDPEHKAKIFERMKGTIGAVMQGTLLTAFAQGTTAGLTYWALGVRFSILAATT